MPKTLQKPTKDDKSADHKAKKIKLIFEKLEQANLSEEEMQLLMSMNSKI